MFYIIFQKPWLLVSELKKVGHCALGCVIITFFQRFYWHYFSWVHFVYIIEEESKNRFFCPTYLILAYKFAWTLLWGKKKFVSFIGFMVLKRPAWAHGFNAKISFEKYALGPEILTKMCPNSGGQTKPSYFETFLSISRDSVRIFQNRFLHWNRELKPVVLSTMKPINETKKNLPHKGVQLNM